MLQSHGTHENAQAPAHSGLTWAWRALNEQPDDMENLSDYLNDHLAGSVGALELLDRVIEACQGKPLERFFRRLAPEVLPFCS